ncbi:hypothetical protein CE143_18940 [Photorhabdus luminescens]|uniref:Uncharacterized protein n=1 Tax=Photorhabdus akhurstii TaxID=171438 RepID=A0ABX8LWV9_9GAMM|nr:hypothetical protein [Photorhabdus akhurstii]QXF35009.1 hypothetical protein B0X70_18905 [Photorhabdus akhurstii]UJD76834.1 hypothetical protein CE143_18940 [Photorhabdus luminescens]
MSEKFIWVPDEDQSYGHQHGSQTITPSSSFDKNIGFTFKMDAGENTLTLNTDNTNSIKAHDIHWPRPSIPVELKEQYEIVHKAENTDKTLGETINISSGNLIISGSQEKPVNFHLNSQITDRYRIKLQNSSTLAIAKANTVRISGPKNKILKPEESAVAISGLSHLTVEASVEIQQENEVIKGNISLECDFSITESSKAMLKSHLVNIYNSNIILQDNAQMLISSQILNIRTDLDEQGQPLFYTNFTLKAGATLLNLNSPNGTDFPLDIHREDYPKGVFNFMAEGKENTGKVVIDVAPKDANAYGLNTMLRKNFIAINGTVVETGDQMKYFDFSYGKDTRNDNQVGTIIISLRNPHLKLS